MTHVSKAVSHNHADDMRDSSPICLGPHGVSLPETIDKDSSYLETCADFIGEFAGSQDPEFRVVESLGPPEPEPVISVVP
jgi:hypothetical protein